MLRLRTIIVSMCNAFEQHVRWVEYSQMMQDLELGIPTQQPRRPEGGGRAVDRAIGAAGDLMQRAKFEPASRKHPVDCWYTERKHLAPAH